ncbi:hypothetical protein AVEN_99111-1 [Araneus ventricosus]|uniref:Uncharacterized protein n=1 Tax=Araneus ventricosus TaxID=182803 RepID=A0A4Y2Q8I6_ARAVE|nr:hypothetical protein AVEN_99111-1 [Araneus ventricosus]
MEEKSKENKPRARRRTLGEIVGDEKNNSWPRAKQELHKIQFWLCPKTERTAIRSRSIYHLVVRYEGIFVLSKTIWCGARSFSFIFSLRCSFISFFIEGNCVRRFVIPAVNFGTADCVDLIDWQAFYVTPPTVLRHIGSHELLKMIQADVPMDGWDFIKFLSHTKAVERIVKLVTEASRKRVGLQNRMDLSELH